MSANVFYVIQFIYLYELTDRNHTHNEGKHNSCWIKTCEVDIETGDKHTWRYGRLERQRREMDTRTGREKTQGLDYKCINLTENTRPAMERKHRETRQIRRHDS